MEKKPSDRSQSDYSYLYFQQTSNEYDEVMGITQVDSREAERFEEGIEPEFLDAEEESPKVPGDNPDSGHVAGASHGGLWHFIATRVIEHTEPGQEKFPAPCHSRVEIDETSNPQQSKLPITLGRDD